MKERSAELVRETNETLVRVKLSIDGAGVAELDTGINFLNHLLGAMSKHGFFDLSINARCKAAFNGHHLIEDIAITLGQAFNSAIGGKGGIRRFGHAIVPMDDALVIVAIDYDGRGRCFTRIKLKDGVVGDLPTEMVPHFLESLASNGRFTLHALSLAGRNEHHKLEALFKALGIALSQAVQIEPRLGGGVSSQKGVL